DVGDRGQSSAQPAEASLADHDDPTAGWAGRFRVATSPTTAGLAAPLVVTGDAPGQTVLAAVDQPRHAVATPAHSRRVEVSRRAGPSWVCPSTALTSSRR